MKLKRSFIVMVCAVMLLISGMANAQPQQPVLSVTNGGWVYLSWTEVAGATGGMKSLVPTIDHRPQMSYEEIMWLWIKSCTSLYYSIEHTTHQKPMKLTSLGGD